MNEIQSADPVARRKAVLLTIAVAFSGLITIRGLTLYKSQLLQWLERNIDLLMQTPWMAVAAGFVLVLPLIFAAGYLFSFGRRVCEARRFPPPGYSVIRDTPVREGRSATNHGRIVQVLAVLLALSALTIPLMIWRVFTTLAGGG